MSSMKHYHDIVRYGHRTTRDVLRYDDFIVIQEKLDGANASFTVDPNGMLKCFSRRVELDENNTLRGFYTWAHSTLKQESLNPDFIYFGEWLVKHKIDYGDALNKFYLFDVYDKTKEKYLSFDFVREEGQRLNLLLIPTFYEGPYSSFDHLQSFVGKSTFSGVSGEGIVVKNVDYTDSFGHQLFVKLVSDAYREVQPQKAPKDPTGIPVEASFVQNFITKARVEKFIHSFIDEGTLHEDFGIEDMRQILNLLSPALWEDLKKEESQDIPEDCKEALIHRAIRSISAKFVKEMLNVF